MFYIYANGESIYDPSDSSYYLSQPKVTVEFGKAGSMEFSMPPTNVFYKSLKQMKTTVSVTLDDDEIFRGRVLSTETDFHNFKGVYCEGDLAYLVDSVQKGEKYNGTTHALFRKIIASHNSRVEPYKRFSVGNITIEDRPIVLVGQSDAEELNVGNINYKQIAINSIVGEWNTTFDYIQTCIIDYCGGYLKTRRVGDVTYIDLLAEYDQTSSQSIELGVNLLDLKQETSAEDLFTVLIPLGENNLTIASVNNGSDELADDRAVSQYGRIVRTHVFNNVTEASTLLENARRYLASNINVPVTVELRAIDMHLLDSEITAIHVGDRVRINSDAHNVTEYLVCTKIEYDLSNPANNTYTFGNPKQTLTERYREDKRKESDTYGNSGGDGSGGGNGSGGSGSAAQHDWRIGEGSEIIKEEIKSEIAEETSAEIDEKIQAGLQTFYDAYINLDPETGTGTLGGLYKVVNNAVDVLTQQVGIDFDAKKNNISMKSLRDNYDSLGQLTSQQIAAVTARVTENSEHVVLMAGKIEGQDNKFASIDIWRKNMETGITAKADNFEVEALKIDLKTYYDELIDAKKTLKKYAGIDIDAKKGMVNISTLADIVNQQGESIKSFGSDINTISDEIHTEANMISRRIQGDEEIIAQIQTRVDDQGSTISLKADKIEIEGMIQRLTAVEGEIDNLKVKKLTADEITTAIGIAERLAVQRLSASSISSPSISISSSDGGSFPVATQAFVTASINSIANGNDLGKHYHKFRENVNGTITLLEPTSTPQSFNIRATRTYKEGVAAAEQAAHIDKITLYNSTEHPVPVYREGAKLYTVYKSASAWNGSTRAYEQENLTFTVSALDAYEHGLRVGAASAEDAIEEAVAAVRISTVGRDYDRSIEHTMVGSSHYIRIPIRATASNGANSDNEAWTVLVSAQEEYTAGRQSVGFDSDVTKAISVTETYNATSHVAVLSIIAKADNNETVSRTYRTGTKAYDAGLEKGLKDGRDNVKIDTKDITFTTTHKVQDKSIVVKAVAKASNDKSGSNTTTISTKDHFDAGVTEGKNTFRDSVYISDLERRSVSGVTEKYNATTHKTSVYVKAIAKSKATGYSAWTAYKNFTVTTGTDAYEAGSAYGKVISELGLNGSVAHGSYATETKDSTGTLTSRYVKVPIKATSQGGGNKTANLIISTDKEYSDGYNFATNTAKVIDTLGYNPNGSAVAHGSYATETKDSAGTLTSRYVRFPIIATSKGGGSKTANLYISTDKEYSDGYNYAKEVTSLGYNPNGSAVYHGSYGTETKDSAGTLTARYVRFPIIATSNGGGSKTANLIISTDKEYSDGYNYAKVVTDISINGAVTHGQYGTETQDSAGQLTARYVKIPIIATSKGGGSKTANLYISTDKEYSDGYLAAPSGASRWIQTIYVNFIGGDYVSLKTSWSDGSTYTQIVDQGEYWDGEN